MFFIANDIKQVANKSTMLGAAFRVISFRKTRVNILCKHLVMFPLQARSQEFLRAGEVSKNQGANSERLNQMQTLRRSSLKNNYIYKPTHTYFMLKRISRSYNIFTRKNKICYVSLPAPYVGPSLSRDHQTLTIMDLKIYCF